VTQETPGITINGDVHGNIIVHGDGDVDMPNGDDSHGQDEGGFIHVTGITHHNADGSETFEDVDLILHVEDYHWSGDSGHDDHGGNS
jgi:hypothetical protein